MTDEHVGRVWELRRCKETCFLILVLRESTRYNAAYECLILYSEDPSLKPGDVKAWDKEGFEEPYRKRIT